MTRTLLSPLAVKNKHVIQLIKQIGIKLDIDFDCN